jgi:hypothetical protein
MTQAIDTRPEASERRTPLVLHRVRFIDDYERANFGDANLGDFELHTILPVGAKVQLEKGVYEVLKVLHRPLEDRVDVTLDWRGR